jgi:O-acetylhomoserine (thiol)-lyase
MRTLGPTLSPFSAFLLLQGVETLHLRMPRHVENTRKVVAFLSSHPSVEKVLYPELPSHADHELCRKLLPNGAGAVFSFDIKGGRKAGKAFIESLRVFSHLANVGDAKSLVIHPASTTHQQLSAEEKQACGISDDLIRLSIGLEEIDDILWDLDQALAAAAKDAG